MKPEPAAPVVSPPLVIGDPVMFGPSPLQRALQQKLAEAGAGGIIARQLVESVTGSAAVKDHATAHAALAALVKAGLVTQDGRRYRLDGANA